MAELNLGKGLTAGKVASNVQKKLTRAQEKVRSDVPHACELTGKSRFFQASPRRKWQCSIHRRGAVSHHDTINTLGDAQCAGMSNSDNTCIWIASFCTARASPLQWHRIRPITEPAILGLFVTTWKLINGAILDFYTRSDTITFVEHSYNLQNNRTCCNKWKKKAWALKHMCLTLNER